MNAQFLRYLALITASQARIEGMKAANYVRRSNNEVDAYSENDFYYEGNELESLSVEIINLV